MGDVSLRVVAPRVPKRRLPDPPAALAPFERRRAPRASGGAVDCTWFPVARPRGAVLLAPPWMEWGQAYFHRRGRVEALREAGYACLAFDLGGFGGSTPTRGFRDRDVEAALDELRRLAPGVPLHAWGVSSGGYWTHHVLARAGDVRGAVFEDVTPHLLEWSARVRPRARRAFLALRRAFPRADRYMDLRNHAPHLRVAAAAYVVGGEDAGIPAADARELARLAGAECLVVPGAGHLQAIKRARGEVLTLALATFRRAESAGGDPSGKAEAVRREP